MSASPTEGTDMNQIEKVARAICAADPEIRMGDAEHIVQQLVNTEWRNYTDAAKAAIAAMQPAPQWQGIETAPRDGEAVLLWIPADDGWDAYVAPGWYESGAFDRRWYAAVGENPFSPQPTHWMPLPTPPAGGSDAE